MNPNSKIYIAGHRGMVGSAIYDNLIKKGYNNIIYKSSTELDLRNQSEVNLFFEKERPEFVFLAAAKVGGIHANNTYRADFIYDNLMVQNNIIHAAFKYESKKLMFLGSSCIYPKFAPQPLKEEYLLTGELEQTNEPYAIAKIAGIKMCESYRRQYGCNFISVMPTNLYGQNDNYDLNNSHVLPALIRKIYDAKENNDKHVIVWGTGTPMREFMYASDMADACVFLMMNYNGEKFVNIGTGKDITIKDLAFLIKNTADFKGEIIFDSTKPDGTPRKLMDVSYLHSLGWKHKIDLEEGVKMVYEEFKLNQGRKITVG
jgi:GDP-L-fucose synthase